MTGWRAALKVSFGDFSLDVELDGDDGVLALVGPNGSGKTSVLRALAGAIPSSDTEIEVAGEVWSSARAGVWRPSELRRVGYVPQGYALFPHLTVGDNVGFGLGGASAADRRRRVMAMLEELGCAELVERRVAGLSGGEQQRVALARALVIEPALLLLDEPLAALDPSVRRTVRRFLAERLRAFGRPAVIVTHDVRDVIALEASVAVLEGGRVVQRGTVDALRAHPASPFVAEFLR